MPRNFKLTWQAGGKGRKGRWRKKYKGRNHYFSGGRGKSDRQAYDSAVLAWECLKQRLDKEAPKPHQEDYEREIETWENVLVWSRKFKDEEITEEATSKLELLNAGLAIAKPKPLPREYAFDGRFDPSIRHPSWLQLMNEIAEGLRLSTEVAGSGGRRTIVVPTQAGLDPPDPLTIEREIWHDRLDVMIRLAASPEETVEHYVAKFLANKKEAVSAKLLSPGRHEKLRSHLQHFADWIGQGTPVVEIVTQTLLDYRTELLKSIDTKKWGRTTAKDRMSSVNSFVRWLWQVEALPTMPRVLDGKSKALDIGKSPVKVVVYKMEEVRLLLENATARTSLYILLMINCGMTQKDISDIDFSEVVWGTGRIVRKRSKTRKFERVPEVSYSLWPETFQLLQQERSEIGSGRVLLNQRGGALWLEELDEKGKYKKNDVIKTAFERLRRKLKFKKPLKSLKKTSASMIHQNRDYRGLEDLFLGHAPGKVSDKHYLSPGAVLDDAVAWLRQEYGIEKLNLTSAARDSRGLLKAKQNFRKR